MYVSMIPKRHMVSRGSAQCGIMWVLAAAVTVVSSGTHVHTTAIEFVGGSNGTFAKSHLRILKCDLEFQIVESLVNKMGTECEESTAHSVWLKLQTSALARVFPLSCCALLSFAVGVNERRRIKKISKIHKSCSRRFLQLRHRHQSYRALPTRSPRQIMGPPGTRINKAW